MHAVKSFNGAPTELLIQKYEDRTLVLVTQVGKVGSLVRLTRSMKPVMFSSCALQTEVSIPQSATLADPYFAGDGSLIIEPSPSIEQKIIFGSASTVHASTLYGLYASHIATLIWTAEKGEGRRNVVVGLALKNINSEKDTSMLSDEERTTFKGVLNMILDSYVSQ